MPLAGHIEFKRYIFCAGSELDFKNTRDLLNAVQDHYVDGKPRHWQDSAMREKLDVTDKNVSAIFVTSYEDHMARSESAISKIFRDRHIIVKNTPHLGDGKFDIDTLRSLVGHSRKYFSIQGSTFPPSQPSGSLLIIAI